MRSVVRIRYATQGITRVFAPAAIIRAAATVCLTHQQRTVEPVVSRVFHPQMRRPRVMAAAADLRAAWATTSAGICARVIQV